MRVKALMTACLAAGVLFAAMLTLRLNTGTRAEARGTPQDVAAIAQIFGIRFVAEAVAQGAHPTLPSGGAGVSMAEAIADAVTNSPAVGTAAQSGQLLPGVGVAAQYGMFSNDRYGRVLPGGRVQPAWQDRPVWIITFAGAGLNFPTLGRVHGFHHELNVVMDAASGRYLMAYLYR